MGASPWDTAEYWVFGIIFGTILAKGLDLMFSDPPRYLGGSILTTLGLVGLLFTIPWTRTKVLADLQILYIHFGSPHPTASLIIVSILGAVLGAIVFGGAWLLLSRAPEGAAQRKGSTDIPGPLKLRFSQAPPYVSTHFPRTYFRVGVFNRNKSLAENVQMQLLGIEPIPKDLTYRANFPYRVTRANGEDDLHLEPIAINPGDEARFEIAQSWISSDNRLMVNRIDTKTRQRYLEFPRGETWRLYYQLSASEGLPINFIVIMRACGDTVSVDLDNDNLGKLATTVAPAVPMARSPDRDLPQLELHVSNFQVIRLDALQMRDDPEVPVKISVHIHITNRGVPTEIHDWRLRVFFSSDVHLGVIGDLFNHLDRHGPDGRPNLIDNNETLGSGRTRIGWLIFDLHLRAGVLHESIDSISRIDVFCSDDDGQVSSFSISSGTK